MLKGLIKLCAKVALDYLPNVGVYVIEMVNDKTNEYPQKAKVLEAVKAIAEDAQLLAQAMEDGKISDTEKDAFNVRLTALAEDIKALL